MLLASNLLIVNGGGGSGGGATDGVEYAGGMCGAEGFGEVGFVENCGFLCAWEWC